jgi:hypothetical protein
MIYTATFAAVAVSAAQDLWELVAPANTKVALREIRLGQYTDFGDAAAELLSIQIIRGYTTTGSGGAAATPASLAPWTVAATSVVARNNTTVAQDGTGLVMLADTFNIASGWWYRPPAQEFILLQASQRLVVRMTAPADSITMSSTIVFEENPPL